MSEILVAPLVSKTTRDAMTEICRIVSNDIRPLIEDEAKAAGHDDLAKAARLGVQPLETIACGVATRYVDDDQLAHNARVLGELHIDRPPLTPREKNAMTQACDIGSDLFPLLENVENYEDIPMLSERADLHLKDATQCALHAALNIPCALKHDTEPQSYREDAGCIKQFAEELTMQKQSGVQKAYLEARKRHYSIG